MVEYKQIFKMFARWFLQNRALRYILKGEMKDKKTYIKYKNEVMLRYLDTPNKWHSNKGKKISKIA